MLLGFDPTAGKDSPVDVGDNEMDPADRKVKLDKV
jgi:hypothetical protein